MTCVNTCSIDLQRMKEMFNLEKWGDEDYKKKLQELVIKDEELVKDVIQKIKLEKGLE